MSTTISRLEIPCFSLLYLQFDVVLENIIKCFCNIRIQQNVSYFQFSLLLGCAFSLKCYKIVFSRAAVYTSIELELYLVGFTEF
jgi:hypothetical protein